MNVTWSNKPLRGEWSNKPRGERFTRKPHDDAAMAIGDAIGLDRAQRERVTAELRAWVVGAGRGGGSTWDCEASGLRLRGGQSVPHHCTADLYGRLVAVKGTDAGARARLLDAVRKRLPSVATDWSKRWTGHRAEHTHADCFSDGVTLVCSAIHDGWQTFDDVGWHTLVALRARANEKWHLARPMSTQLTSRTSIHYGQSLAPHVTGLREVGAGPVSIGVMPDEALLVVVPEPGASPDERACEVLRAHVAMLHFNASRVAAGYVDFDGAGPRWRCVVADFELA